MSSRCAGTEPSLPARSPVKEHPINVLNCGRNCVLALRVLPEALIVDRLFPRSVNLVHRKSHIPMRSGVRHRRACLYLSWRTLPDQLVKAIDFAQSRASSHKGEAPAARAPPPCPFRQRREGPADQNVEGKRATRKARRGYAHVPTSVTALRRMRLDRMRLIPVHRQGVRRILNGVAPAVICTAELGRFRDHGAAYATEANRRSG
jgi:hypothetical protein